MLSFHCWCSLAVEHKTLSLADDFQDLSSARVAEGAGGETALNEASNRGLVLIFSGHLFYSVSVALAPYFPLKRFGFVGPVAKCPIQVLQVFSDPKHT